MENETQNERNDINYTTNIWYKDEDIQRKNIHNNFNELQTDLELNAEELIRFYTMKNEKKYTSFSALDISEIIMCTCDVIKLILSDDDGKIKSTYLIYNPRTKTYERNKDYLQELCNILVTKGRNRSSFTNLIKDIDGLIKSSPKLRIANIPPSHIIKLKNCIYDLKNKCEHDGLDENNNEYDFINRINYNLKLMNNVNQTHLTHVKKVFNLWSSDNIDNELFIKQMVLAAIEGNGRNKYIILKSEGGDGKSTFQYLLQLFAGKNNTEKINIHQFDDDNAINGISQTTKLIIGDDLENRYKMSNKAMTILKTIISGYEVSVSEKFMPNKLISTNALMIQNTNSDINFYENTSATQSRFIIFNWPHYNFRDNPITEFNLDDLLGIKKNNNNQNKNKKPNIGFMEAILSYIIYTTDYFNTFTVTEQMKQNTNEVIASNDTINLFLEDLQDIKLLEYSHIPSKLIYEYYKDWLKTNNPGSQPMKIKEFSQRFSKEISNYGYVDKTRKSINRLEEYEFNSDYLLNQFTNNYMKMPYQEMLNNNIQCMVYINPNKKLDNEILTYYANCFIKNNKAELENASEICLKESFKIACQTQQSLIAIFELNNINDIYNLNKEEILNLL